MGETGVTETACDPCPVQGTEMNSIVPYIRLFPHTVVICALSARDTQPSFLL